eukprot:gnl/MRDRNA2_/MRDRNA2_68465_c0_seq2.p1 gnl/MRDRNA2_/MRDRNA2_68465_c0~~gnl/MRDRNA2_/MRDRNA2_68465_c0_seq2.p1  ORF type:complete len:389 (+),score=42.06 gnl/MRDRNA2_/MRDRNA2_68465_c0_seq2:118-1284(+)
MNSVAAIILWVFVAEAYDNEVASQTAERHDSKEHFIKQLGDRQYWPNLRKSVERSLKMRSSSHTDTNNITLATLHSRSLKVWPLGNTNQNSSDMTSLLSSTSLIGLKDLDDQWTRIKTNSKNWVDSTAMKYRDWVRSAAMKDRIKSLCRPWVMVLAIGMLIQCLNYNPGIFPIGVFKPLLELLSEIIKGFQEVIQAFSPLMTNWVVVMHLAGNYPQIHQKMMYLFAFSNVAMALLGTFNPWLEWLKQKMQYVEVERIWNDLVKKEKARQKGQPTPPPASQWPGMPPWGGGPEYGRGRSGGQGRGRGRGQGQAAATHNPHPDPSHAPHTASHPAHPGSEPHSRSKPTPQPRSKPTDYSSFFDKYDKPPTSSQEKDRRQKGRTSKATQDE